MGNNLERAPVSRRACFAWRQARTYGGLIAPNAHA